MVNFYAIMAVLPENNDNFMISSKLATPSIIKLSGKHCVSKNYSHIKIDSPFLEIFFQHKY